MAISVGGTEYVYGTCQYYTNTSSAMRYECRLAVTLNSQSTANNTSTVTLVLQVRSTNSSYTTQNTQTSVINGTTMASGASFNMGNTNVWQTFASRTQTVTHNADGSYSFPVSASFTTNATSSAWSLKSGSISGAVTLNTIPRASSISCDTIVLGSAGTITISTASSSFTHTITAAFGSTSTTVITKTSSTSVPWTPSLSWASQIPNATSGTCTLTCITYSGSTEVGRKAISISLTVPASVKPSLTSLTATRVDGSVPSAWATYVKGKSKVTLAISGAAGSYGSTIKGYSISGGGYSSTASSYTTGYLNTTGTITFTAYVTDSRGRKSDSKTVSITVYDYTAPTITALSAYRCGVDGVANPSGGTYIRVSGSYTFASVNSKNIIASCTVYYRVVGASSWTSGGTLATGSYIVTGGGNIAVASNYEVRYVVTDGLGSSVERIVTVNAASRTMNIRPNAVAFGMMSTGENRFESAWPIYEQGKRVAAIETGTWTPVLRTNTGGLVAATYIVQEGHFTKNGELIHVGFRIAFTADLSTYNNAVYIGDLPCKACMDEWGGTCAISAIDSSLGITQYILRSSQGGTSLMIGRREIDSIRYEQFSNRSSVTQYRYINGSISYIAMEG